MTEPTLKLLLIDEDDRIFFDGKELPQKEFRCKSLLKEIYMYKLERYGSIGTDTLIYLLSEEYPELKGYYVYRNHNLGKTETLKFGMKKN